MTQAFLLDSNNLCIHKTNQDRIAQLGNRLEAGVLTNPEGTIAIHKMCTQEVIGFLLEETAEEAN